MIQFNRWADDIDLSSLAALLRYVGEFGAVACLLRLETGIYPMPPTDMEDYYQLRKHYALVSIAMAYTGEIQADDSGIAGVEPAFPEDFQQSLLLDKKTVWAADLNVKSYEMLLWNIGEFSLYCLTFDSRDYVIPNFSNYPMFNRYMRVSLYNIVRIFEWCLRNKNR